MTLPVLAGEARLLTNPRFDETALVREYDRLHPISKAQLGEHVGNVRLDRAFAEVKVRGELRVALARGEQPQDLKFAFGE
jgi:hypothetical protein